jgi:hypothetical protein
MVFDVILYDKYFNIPLRGLLQTSSSALAFDASILDDEPAEIADRLGIYSRLRGFECDDALKLILEEKDSIFCEWRATFNQGGVDKSTHPLYVDARYQQLSVRADELFDRLSTPIIEARGLMRIVSGKFVFECLDVTVLHNTSESG